MTCSHTWDDRIMKRRLIAVILETWFSLVADITKFKKAASCVSFAIVNTLHAAIGIAIHTNWFYFLKFSWFQKFLNQYLNQAWCILFWMHFSWWFQIMITKFQNFEFVDTFVTFLTCRLHTPAAWKVHVLQQPILLIVSSNGIVIVTVW